MAWVLGDILIRNSLNFWNMRLVLEDTIHGAEFALPLFACIGFLPGRDKTYHQDPLRGMKRRSNAFRFAVLPDKLATITEHLHDITVDTV